jgi:hypothetical protein
MRVARAALVILAVALCAWFVVGARQAHDLAAAQSVINASDRPTSAQAARAWSLLHSAAFLNPDRSVQLARSALALAQNRPQVARGYAERATRAEPLNILAWSQLIAVAAALGDGRLVSLAGPHVRQLEPRLPFNH